MYSKFKLTLAAVAVSVVLTGCKSNNSPSIIAPTPKPKEISADRNSNNPKKPSPETKRTDVPSNASEVPHIPKNTEKGVGKPIKNEEKPQTPNKPSTSSSESVSNNPTADKEESLPVEPTVEENKANQAQDSEENSAEESPQTQINGNTEKFTNTDSNGNPYRVVNLNPRKSVVNASPLQKVYFDSFTADSVENSPFESSDSEKEYNNNLVFDLGNSNSESYFKRLNPTENHTLGIHQGVYEDNHLEGNAQKINYLYVNQPYSSYGALFSDANDSHLFSVHLSAGQSGENARGEVYSEYGVFNNESKWNDNLVGDATYKGQAIARVVRYTNGEDVANQPQFDGDVTLNLHLTEDWENSKLSGQINSHTLGQITLNESKITPASYINSNLRFAEEATVENSSNFEGDYHVDFTGPNLEDAVGAVELENEELKYNAVFGASKSAN